MEEFPGNRRTDRPEDKKVKRIVEGNVVRRRQPLGKRFASLFVAGDSRSVTQYVFMDVLLPAAKDMVADAVSQGVERMIFGEVRSSARRTFSGSNTSYTPYNRYSTNRIGGPPRDHTIGRPQMSRQARARHDFDEIILATRREAEEVLDQMRDSLARYETVSVSDLYEMVGEDSSFTDEKWGWTDLTGSSVSRTRDGYLLNLPRPVPID